MHEPLASTRGRSPEIGNVPLTEGNPNDLVLTTCEENSGMVRWWDMGVSIVMGLPQVRWMVYVMEKRSNKNGSFRVTSFMETTI